MEIAVTLSRNVRRVRQERGLSLGALAAASGMAKQTLANVESARGNPTIETLQSLGAALGLPVNWLVTAWDRPALVHRLADADWEETDIGRRRLLDRIHGVGQVDTVVLELAADQATRPALPAGSLHHAYVLEGRVTAGPVEDHHDLTAGDFIRFYADGRHVLRARAGTACVHLVTTIPQVHEFGPRSS